MHAVTASGLDCSFSHPKRLGTPRVGEGNRSEKPFGLAQAGSDLSGSRQQQQSSGRRSTSSQARRAIRQQNRSKPHFSKTTGKPAHASRRCCKASVAGYRGRTGRPTVGHAIGRRRADRSGSGVAPARIGRAAGIWDRDSLLAGVALWWFLVGSVDEWRRSASGERGDGIMN